MNALGALHKKQTVKRLWPLDDVIAALPEPKQSIAVLGRKRRETVR
jgi:hypothetical protein